MRMSDHKLRASMRPQHITAENVEVDWGAWKPGELQ